MSKPVSYVMPLHIRAARIVALAMAAVAVGCGGSDLDRIPVAGRVRFNGEALAKGQIRFIPQSGTKGPVTVEPINAGQYATDNTGGVPVGSHRVEIRGYDAHEYATAPTGPGSPPIKQLLPAKYNSASELSATLNPSSDHELNFDLAP
jgi:hypothetical protein